jgi:N-acetylmuramoyl-L-alanine amidase
MKSPRSAIMASLLLIVLTPLAAAQFVVVIDPGHGGAHVAGKSDSTQEGDGASWNNARTATKKLLEKDLTLSFAIAAKQAFEQSNRARDMKIRVVLTRDRDVHLSAMERAAVAVRESADVFLSIHFNAANGKAEGTRAFFVSSDHPEWQFMHFTNAYESRDRRFCELVCQHVANAFQPFGGKPEKRSVYGDVGDRKDGLRMLGFARQDTHLYKAAMGLLEVEFIDNPAVEAWLVSDTNKANVERAAAEGIVNATCDFLALPPAEREVVEKARKAPGR